MIQAPRHSWLDSRYTQQAASRRCKTPAKRVLSNILLRVEATRQKL